MPFSNQPSFYLQLQYYCGGLSLPEYQVSTKQLYHSPPQQGWKGENEILKTAWVKQKAV